MRLLMNTTLYFSSSPHHQLNYPGHMRLKAEVLAVELGRVFDGEFARMDEGGWGRAWRTGIRVCECAYRA